MEGTAASNPSTNTSSPRLHSTGSINCTSSTKNDVAPPAAEWMASGQNLTSSTDCQQANVANSQKAVDTYEARV
ncbi:MAG TPA: hypothetical protein VJ724_01630 [Tahibacter sp.]|nr:hypothetical protein [Tahibacter sp.]